MKPSKGFVGTPKKLQILRSVVPCQLPVVLENKKQVSTPNLAAANQEDHHHLQIAP
jgi:hypothetical protein